MHWKSLATVEALSPEDVRAAFTMRIKASASLSTMEMTDAISRQEASNISCKRYLKKVQFSRLVSRPITGAKVHRVDLT